MAEEHTVSFEFQNGPSLFYCYPHPCFAQVHRVPRQSSDREMRLFREHGKELSHSKIELGKFIISELIGKLTIFRLIKIQCIFICYFVPTHLFPPPHH